MTLTTLTWMVVAVSQDEVLIAVKLETNKPTWLGPVIEMDRRLDTFSWNYLPPGVHCETNALAS